MSIHPCIPPGRYTPKAYQVWSIELNLRATFTTKTPLSRHAGDGTIGRSSCLSGGYSEKNPASVVQFRENLGIGNHSNGLSMFFFLNCCFFGSWPPQRINHDQPISTCISLLVLQRICDEILSEAAPGRVICSLQRGGEAVGHGLSRRISYWSGRICEHSAPRLLWKCMVFPMFYSPMLVEKWINKCMNRA